MNSNTPYKLNWMDLRYLGLPEKVAIGALPGCRHRFIARSFHEDAEVIVQQGIRYAFVLCEDKELDRFGVPNIISEFNSIGILSEHYPCEFGLFPAIETVLEIIKRIFIVVEGGDKCIIISRDGLGRSCVVASALLLHTDDALTFSDVYDIMKKLVGTRAIPTVKQYNFIVDFRQARDDYQAGEVNYENMDYPRRISR